MFKLKSTLWGLAAMGLVACSGDSMMSESESENETVGNLYMTFNMLSNSTQTRADDYDAGTGESEIYYAVGVKFFFFDNEGNPVAVSGKCNYVNGSNYVGGSSFVTNESDYSTTSPIIAVLEQMKLSSAPAQVVAVVNCFFDLTQETYTLNELRQLLVDAPYSAIQETPYFIMANAAYYDGSKEVYATPISALNLATSVEEAAKNPVNIHVERLAARITVNTSDGSDDAIKLTNGSVKFYGEQEETQLYVSLAGWCPSNYAATSCLIKNIDGFNATLGTANTINGVTAWSGWNHADLHRCDWSVTNSQTTNLVMNNNMKWEILTCSYNDEENKKANSSFYLFENTLASTETVDNCSKIVFGGQICDNQGTPISFGYWQGQYYRLEGANGLKAAIANALSDQLFSYSSEEQTWTAISADDIEFYTTADTYHVKAQVKEHTTWYANKQTKAYTDEEVKTITEAIPQAKVWNNGMCYYYTKMLHNNGTNDLEGVVRNHWYQFTIGKISGFGTPVYDATNPFTPVRPAEESWNLDVKLTIQDWKVQKHTTNLE